MSELEKLKKQISINWEKYTQWETDPEYLKQNNYVGIIYVDIPISKDWLSTEELNKLRDYLQDFLPEDNRTTIFSEPVLISSKVEDGNITFFIEHDPSKSDNLLNVEDFDSDVKLVPSMASTHCRRCGRGLKNPLSIQRGYGPICFHKIDVPTVKSVSKHEVDSNEIVNTPELGDILSDWIRKKATCSCGRKVTFSDNIHAYPHHGGVLLKDGTKWWVYVVCSKCHYQNSFYKIERRLEAQQSLPQYFNQNFTIS